MFFGRSDHCHQWFYDGFLMLLPSLSMVFDGSGPLVKRCDGFDGSLWSRAKLETCTNHGQTDTSVMEDDIEACTQQIDHSSSLERYVILQQSSELGEDPPRKFLSDLPHLLHRYDLLQLQLQLLKVPTQILLMFVENDV